MAFIKCQNCGGTTFAPTKLGWILATEGQFTVNAYACQNCGHIELFEPSLDPFVKLLREEEERMHQQKAMEMQKQEEELKARIEELTNITENENSTVKQVREANEELKRLHEKLKQLHATRYPKKLSDLLM